MELFTERSIQSMQLILECQVQPGGRSEGSPDEPLKAETVLYHC